MRTLGVDLASQPKKTAACEIAWGKGTATAGIPLLGMIDGDLLDLAAPCDVVGIDAAFGWPQPFVEFLTRRPAAGTALPVWQKERRDRLCFRLTDLRVWTELGRPPLSVASDKIALPAMRCAGLLDALGVDDRSGDGRVFEVYPAVALKRWGLAASGYKSPRGAPRRDGEPLSVLLGSLLQACPWLDLPDEAATLCARDDDAFDALVSALVARAAGLGLTMRPTAEEAERAKVEGWIAVPLPGSLDRLVSEPMDPADLMGRAVGRPGGLTGLG